MSASNVVYVERDVDQQNFVEIVLHGVGAIEYVQIEIRLSGTNHALVIEHNDEELPISLFELENGQLSEIEESFDEDDILSAAYEALQTL